MFLVASRISCILGIIILYFSYFAYVWKNLWIERTRAQNYSSLNYIFAHMNHSASSSLAHLIFETIINYMRVVWLSFSRPSIAINIQIQLAARAQIPVMMVGIGRYRDACNMLLFCTPCALCGDGHHRVVSAPAPPSSHARMYRYSWKKKRTKIIFSQ